MRSERVPLGRLISSVSGRAGKNSSLPVYSVTKHRGFVPSVEYFKKQVFAKDLSTYKVVEPDQFAYATIHLDEGSIGFAPESCLVSPMYTVFAVDDSLVDRDYLFAYLKSPRALASYANIGRGSAERRRSISLEALSRLTIPLPPLPEQRRIASILDGTQRLVENQRRADLLSAALSARIFQDRFLNAPEREWRVLGDVADFRSGATPSKANHDYWAGSVPWFSPKDLKSNSLRDSIDHVSESALRETSIGQFEPDTVVFVTRGMILAHSFPVSIVTVPFTMNQDLKALALREKTDPWFLAFALRSQTPTVLASVSNSGHGTKRIETDFLRRLRLPWATEAEQLSFGVLARELEASDRRRASRRDLAMRLTRSVQDQAFRGKL